MYPNFIIRKVYFLASLVVFNYLLGSVELLVTAQMKEIHQSSVDNICCNAYLLKIFCGLVVSK
jgi:hypothetical protein